MTENLLNEFHLISLDEMNAASLLDRLDSKFVCSHTQLLSLLPALQESYRLLQIDDRQSFNYSSQYYDTKDYNYYLDHHRGKPNRVKIRHRSYLNSNLHFFEIKKKIKGIRTLKSRWNTKATELGIGQNELAWMQAAMIHEQNLQPTAKIDYQRMTLCNKNLRERVTIDLQMTACLQNNSHHFENLAIIELKQDRYNWTSPAWIALRKMGIKALPISKYSLSMALLCPNLKHNNFNQSIRQIQNISKEWKQ
jgi:hypothetical protein